MVARTEEVAEKLGAMSDTAFVDETASLKTVTTASSVGLPIVYCT